MLLPAVYLESLPVSFTICGRTLSLRANHRFFFALTHNGYLCMVYRCVDILEFPTNSYFERKRRRTKNDWRNLGDNKTAKTWNAIQSYRLFSLFQRKDNLWSPFRINRKKCDDTLNTDTCYDSQQVLCSRLGNSLAFACSCINMPSTLPNTQIYTLADFSCVKENTRTHKINFDNFFVIDCKCEFHLCYFIRYMK